MAYPRKRAAVACNYCRHRKRRCDARTPTCGLCADSGVECEYPEVSNAAIIPETDIQHILDRLTELEAQVKQQSESMTKAHERQQPTPLALPHIESLHSTTLDPGPEPHQSPSIYSGTIDYETRPEATNMGIPWTVRSFTDDSRGTTDALRPGTSNCEISPGIGAHSMDTQDISLTIPVGHWTTTGSLLLLPQIKSLLGDYPENFLLQLESSRSTLVQDSVYKRITDNNNMPEIYTEDTDALIDSFFTYIHPSFPVLDRDSLIPLYHSVLKQGIRSDAKSALCLVVFALGKIAMNMFASPSPEDQSHLHGLEYFSPAYRIVVAEWGLGYDVGQVLPLALIHTALYFQYMNLPLQAWRMVHLTSISLQHSVVSSKRSHPNHNASSPSTRLYWACFIFESDIVAEFHVPRTGIELLVNYMQFPSFSMYANRNAMRFLALCSMRRLLNRIHSTLYNTEQRTENPTSSNIPGESESRFHSASIVAEAKFEGVCNELVRQLKTWYESLPDEIKPDLDNQTPRDIQDGCLSLRYWSAMHIIGRPFVIFVVMSQDKTDFPPHVMKYCKLSLDSCRSSITMARHILTHQTADTWVIIHALLACSLMVSLASITPALQPMVPNTAQLLGQVSEAVRPWAVADSTAETISRFVQLIRQKLRLSAIGHAELDA